MKCQILFFFFEKKISSADIAQKVVKVKAEFVQRECLYPITVYKTFWISFSHI